MPFCFNNSDSDGDTTTQFSTAHFRFNCAFFSYLPTCASLTHHYMHMDWHRHGCSHNIVHSSGAYSRLWRNSSIFPRMDPWMNPTAKQWLPAYQQERHRSTWSRAMTGWPPLPVHCANHDWLFPVTALATARYFTILHTLLLLDPRGYPPNWLEDAPY